MHAVTYVDCMHADTTPVSGNADLGDSHQVAYRVRHAAELVDLSERQMWEYVRTGEIASFKIGTARRIPRAALIAFIERMRAATEVADETHPPAGPSTPPPPSGPGKNESLRRAG